MTRQSRVESGFASSQQYERPQLYPLVQKFSEWKMAHHNCYMAFGQEIFSTAHVPCSMPSYLKCGMKNCMVQTCTPRADSNRTHSFSNIIPCRPAVRQEQDKDVWGWFGGFPVSSSKFLRKVTTLVGLELQHPRSARTGLELVWTANEDRTIRSVTLGFYQKSSEGVVEG